MPRERQADAEMNLPRVLLGQALHEWVMDHSYDAIRFDEATQFGTFKHFLPSLNPVGLIDKDLLGGGRMTHRCVPRLVRHETVQ